MSADSVMAKDVMISKLYQAVCYRRDCDLGLFGGRWVSEPTDRRAEADKARSDHLDAHRERAARLINAQLVTLSSPESPEIDPRVREAFDDAMEEARHGRLA